MRLLEGEELKGGRGEREEAVGEEGEGGVRSSGLGRSDELGLRDPGSRRSCAACLKIFSSFFKGDVSP